MGTRTVHVTMDGKDLRAQSELVHLPVVQTVLARLTPSLVISPVDASLDEQGPTAQKLLYLIHALSLIK